MHVEDYDHYSYREPRKANPFLLGFAQGLCAGALMAVIAAALVLRVANLHIVFQ